MTDVMVETMEQHGSLVAFEGPQDIISTQLRLLPNSSQILTLPSFEHFIEENDPSSPFSARLQVLRIHEACEARTEMARMFLRESTPDNKRLVFMNGGTASAVMSCIATISEHETGGDTTRAETIFNELIQNGIAGLKRQDTPKQEVETTTTIDGMADTDEGKVELPEDPISKAMRAADALDLETAFLQEAHELDLTTTVRPRSISVPTLPMPGDLQDAAPYVFSPAENTQEVPPPSAISQGHNLYVEKWRAVTANEDQLTDPNTTPRSPSCVSETRPYDRLRPTSAVGPPRASVESMPSSPALLGEALLVDVRPVTSATPKRTMSVDQIFATTSRNQSPPQPTVPEPEDALRIWEKTERKESNSSKRPSLRSTFYSEVSCPALARPNRTIVRKCLPSPLKLGRAEQMASSAHQDTHPDGTYAHRGTIMERTPSALETGRGERNSFVKPRESFELDADEQFQTVLPMTEDLVILFKGEENEPRLEAMIEAFKHGAYPVSMPPLLSETKADTDQPGTPSSRGSTQRPGDKDAPDSQPVMQEPVPIYSPDEYDPFSSHGNYLWPPATTYLSKQDIGSQPQETAVVPPLPTLPLAPPLRPNTLSDKTFHDFDIKDCKTAMCIQNALRSILNVYFPGENMGCRRFDFTLIHEPDGFWRPIFGRASTGASKTTRNIDLILGIGAQKNEDNGLLGAIGSSLEKLGRAPNGVSRSGKLDLRYLIANSMQAFTSCSPANQTQDNPLTNPLILATLIIPHLETYMAAHSAIRFLILEYPAEYLSTVLALQHLLGVDLLKVVGIVDAEAGSPKSPLLYRKPELHIITYSTEAPIGKATSGTPFLQKSSKPRLLSRSSEGGRAQLPSFSKANFIITSTATESEIATLISNVWRVLIDISASYVPEAVTGSSWKYNYNHPPSPSSLVHPDQQYAPLSMAAAMLGFVPPQDDGRRQQAKPQRGKLPDYVSSGTHADLPALVKRPVTPARSTKASIAETYRSSPTTWTHRTPRSAHNQRNKLRHMLGRDPAELSPAEGDTETIRMALYYEPEDDETGQFAAEERKYMPLWSNPDDSSKGNSRKALKWLGLSS